MAREITETVLLKLDEKISGNGKMIIRVVSWNNGKPMLEKRNLFLNDDDEWQNGKAKGLSLEDFELLLKNKDKILKIMKGVKQDGKKETKSKKGK